jgi:hypothetical protein
MQDIRQKRQETGDRRQETRDKRQEARNKRQETRDRRQEGRIVFPFKYNTHLIFRIFYVFRTSHSPERGWLDRSHLWLYVFG